MNEQGVTEPPEARPGEDEIKTERPDLLVGLLQEYADKLAALNRELLHVFADGYWYYYPARLAWLLDRADRLAEPVRRLTHRAVKPLGRRPQDPVAVDELELRRIETETHLHHTLRLSDELRKRIDKKGWKFAEQVAGLRVAAGLSGTKGGPLRPN